MVLQLPHGHARCHLGEHRCRRHRNGTTVAFPRDRFDNLFTVFLLIRKHEAQVDFVSAGGVVLVVVGAGVPGGYLHQMFAGALL